MRAAWIAVALVLVSILGLTQDRAVAQEPLSISGTLWWDKNGDGQRQVDDAGLGLAGVWLQGPGGIRLVTRTDFNGAYSFSGLTPGQYLVDATGASGFVALYMTFPETDYDPPATRAVSLGAESVSGVDFGLYRPEGVPWFTGTVWVKATSVPAIVRALVNGVDCTGPVPISPPSHSPENTYSLKVLSAEQKAGCGKPGDKITFLVNGMNANQEVEWQPVGPGQSELKNLILVVGPEFAVFYPYVVEQESTEGQQVGHTTVIIALIDGQMCGTVRPQALGGDELIIRPLELPGGCGYEGALITFSADGYAVQRSVHWHGVIDYEEIALQLKRGPDQPKAGPPFAYYMLDMPATQGLYRGSTYQVIEVWVGRVRCGRVFAEGPVSVELAVAPDEVEDGCGTPGATVTFLYGEEVIGSAPWQPGYHAGPEVLAPSNAGSNKAPGQALQILPPSVGDAGFALTLSLQPQLVEAAMRRLVAKREQRCCLGARQAGAPHRRDLL